MALVEAFYAEQSYGQFALQTDVFGVYSVPLDDTATRSDVAREAQAAASADGHDLAVYGRHFVYVSPTTNYVQAGYGDLSGVWIALQAEGPSAPGFPIAAHELGHHLFNLNHSHGLVCSDGTPIGGSRSATCELWEYGDTLDIMGEGYGHFGAIIKQQVGWLNGAQSVATVTNSGDYRLLPFEAVDAGVKAVAVKSKQGWVYWLEYRQPIGFDAGQPYAQPANLFSGVVVHVALNTTELLRMTPAPSAPNPQIIDTPALGVGASYCDKTGQLSFSVLTADAGGAVVRIKVGGSCK